MQAEFDQFRALGAQIIVVSFVSPERLGRYLNIRPSPFRFFADPARAAYRAFGLKSATWLQILRPRVIARYFSLIFRGRMPHMAQEDVLQLGGDFVLDRAGRIVYEYRSQDPADRPSISDLLEAVRQASA